MKRKINLVELLKTLSFFNKKGVFDIGVSLGLKNTTINTYVSRLIKSREIVHLKNGLYVTSKYYNDNKSDISYQFFLANVIRTPSYISSWTALQYYNMTTEVIYPIISVSKKITRKYNTLAGNYTYHSIDENLFSDFVLIKGKFDFFIATPSKALFDLLYFKTDRFRGLKIKDIKILIEELRIDFHEMETTEIEKFYSLIKKYTHE